MSDEISKEQTQNNKEDDVQMRKKQAEVTPEASEAEQADSPKEEAKPAYSAKAQTKATRSRVAFADGFEPSTTAKPSSAKAVDNTPAPTAEEMVANAVPEADSVTTDDFAAMFEDNAAQTPQRKRYNVGDQINGMIEHIDTNHIFVNMGGRGEGRASRAQFTNDEGELEIALGQEFQFFVLDIKADGIILGKHMDERDAGIFAVEQAMVAGLPVRGKVTGKNKGGFEVELLGVEAFCPRSQIDLYGTEDMDQYLDQTFEFRITDVRDGGRSVVVSRAALLRDEASKQREKTMELVEPGAVLSGIVRSLSEYGAFVDLGGIDGLVHISELSWGAIDHPKEVVQEGQQVDVKILSVETRDNQTRISLSMKQVGDDPWDNVNTDFSVGLDVEGTVVRLTNYGAFVELKPGIDGLVHISEMSWKRIAKPSDVVAVGDTITVRIKSIDLTKNRIGLSMREAKGDPWSGVETRYAEGQEISGTVEKVEDFGAFVALEEGLTALLPRSEMALGPKATPHTTYKQGQVISAYILRIELDRRRMALSAQSAEDRPASQPQQSRKSNKPNKSNKSNKNQKPQQKQESFGTFADLFKK